MKILVVAAMPNELKVIKTCIKSANLKVNLNIDYLYCGIWNYETISSLEHYLTNNKEPIFIFNIWVCGHCDKNIEKISEPIQVASVVNIHTAKEMLIPPFLQLAPLKSCFSGENLLFDGTWLKYDFLATGEEMYFDIWSRWVAFVALKYRHPYLILRIPFSLINADEWMMALNYSDLSDEILAALFDLSYFDYLQKILYWINSL